MKKSDHTQPLSPVTNQVNNTGLVVTAGAATLITSYNLTFTTNAPEQGLNIRRVSHTKRIDQGLLFIVSIV